MAAHSRIGASSASRWMACPGSVALSAAIESKSSSYADEGTRAHELAEKCLRAGRRADSRDFDKNVSREMVDAVNVYIDDVLGNVDYASVWFEYKFHLKEVDEDCFGTADCVSYDESTRTLHVRDLKYGKGVIVDPVENPQGLYYALGAYLSLGKPISRVIISIIQPRGEHPDGPIRRWETDAWRLIEFAAELKASIARVRAADAPLVAGKQCRFCPVAATCPELYRQAQLTASHEFEVIDLTQPLPDPAGMDSAELGRRLKQLAHLRVYGKAIEAFAYAEAGHNRIPNDFKLVDKRPVRKWVDPDTAKAQLRQWFTEDFDKLLTEPELKTPAQVEKVLGKRHKDDIAELIEKKSSGTKLVPLSEGGDAVDVDEFEVVE